jgi:hypothetical protein
MAADTDDRFEIERVVKRLDEASSEFERLVRTKDATALLDELAKLKQVDLWRILLARVLLEQQRRADRISIEQRPSGHAPNRQ